MILSSLLIKNVCYFYVYCLYSEKDLKHDDFEFDIFLQIRSWYVVCCNSEYFILLTAYTSALLAAVINSL